MFFYILLFFSAAFAFAQAPTDTLYSKKFPRLENASIMFPVASAPDMPVGVWRIPGNKTSSGTVVWFHGGMTSNNCKKGLIAGSDLSKMLPTYTIVSASACKQNHWMEPSTIESLDEALDNLAKKIKKDIPEISLVGISDGSLGVIAYSLWGKRNVKNRILMSSFGEALGPAIQIAQQPTLQNGRWRFIQGGKDRLYPADRTFPWIQEFCQNVGTPCDVKFDQQGEHDWSYWQKQHKEWILEFFSK